jgi:hypothetical protein
MSAPDMLDGAPIFTVRGRYGHKARVRLAAYWEVAGDPFSDDYVPAETPADELFGRWCAYLTRSGKDSRLPIYWYVVGDSPFALEGMPGCANRSRLSQEDGSAFYGYPEDDDGWQWDWVELPVADKLWRPGRADKGGFIQEVTGWKPFILQPFVQLDSLVAAVGSRNPAPPPSPPPPQPPTRLRVLPAKKKPTGRKPIGTRLRAQIMERDGFRCRRCGRGVEHGITLHLDHIVAVARGGTNEADNLQTLCGPCNLGKAARSPTAHDLRVLEGTA